MNVLIIGPSVERSKGGTATVIYEHINNPTINKHNKLRYMASHVDGSRFEKAYVLARCLFHILIYHNKYGLIKKLFSICMGMILIHFTVITSLI